MKPYQRKPQLVEAAQWKGKDSLPEFQRQYVQASLDSRYRPKRCPSCEEPWIEHADAFVHGGYGTLVREVLHPGDWFIKDENGLLSKMSNEEFLEQFEEVPSET